MTYLRVDGVFLLPEGVYIPGSVVLGCGNDWICLLYQWQTLVAGIIALIAAIITIMFIKTQISIQKKQLDNEILNQEDMLRRRISSGRVLLLDALHEISRYSEQFVKHIYGASAANGEPDFPQDALMIVKTVLEHAHPNATELLTQIAIRSQIFRARCENHDWKHNYITKSDRMYDGLLLRALAAKAFDYARGDVDDIDSITLSFDEMEATRKITVRKLYDKSPDSAYDRLVEQIANRHPPA